MAVSAATVAESLRSEVTRVATLDALEALEAPIPSAVALAAAPALVDAMATEKARASFDRCGLLLARLFAEALPDSAPVFGATMAGERVAAITAPALLAEALQRASSEGQPLTLEDARSYAFLSAHFGPSYVRGGTVPWAAAGRTVIEYMNIVSFFSPYSASASAVLSLAHPSTLSVDASSVDEPGPDDVPTEDALGRCATADADAAGRVAEVGGATGVGNRWRVEERRGVPHGAPRAGTCGDGAWADRSGCGALPHGRERGRYG